MSRDLFFGHSESQQADHFPITGHFLGIFWLPPSPMYVLEFTPTACTPHPQSDSAISPWGLQDSTVFGSWAKGELGLLLPVITRGLGVLLFFFQAPFYSAELLSEWTSLFKPHQQVVRVYPHKKKVCAHNSFLSGSIERSWQKGGRDRQTDRQIQERFYSSTT